MTELNFALNNNQGVVVYYTLLITYSTRGRFKAMDAHRWSRGWFGEPARRLSLLELVDSGSLNLRLAAVFWLIMEHRASVLVAAGPSNAGKSTLLNALLDFLPPEVEQVRLEGSTEDFQLVAQSNPAVTYMVASELSPYGFYLWGDEARKAFELLSRGYGLGATIHARTLKEAIGILYAELSLPLPLIASLDAIIIIRMTGNWRDAARRVETAGLLTGAEKDGISMAVIAFRSPESGELEFSDETELYAAISARFDIEREQVGAEIQIREQFLSSLLKEGRHSSDELRKAVVEFYRSRPS